MTSTGRNTFVGIVAGTGVLLLVGAYEKPTTTPTMQEEMKSYDTTPLEDEGPRMVPRSARTAAHKEALRRLAVKRAAEAKWREEAVRPKLELLQATATSDAHRLTVTGRIRNNSSNDYRLVTVRFHVYDAQGNRVGSALGTIVGLKSGEVWKFRALYLGANAARYRLHEIAGF